MTRSTFSDPAAESGPTCPVCNGTWVHPWAHVQRSTYVRCSVCATLFVHPFPTADATRRFYDDGQFYLRAEEEADRLRGDAFRRARSLLRLAGRFGLGRSLLDVGCASGIFLKTCRELGWSTTGVEFSSGLAAQAAAAGLRVLQGDFETYTGLGVYDIVTAWEVLEHVRQPQVFLKALAGRVREGGLLALSTPLATGVPAVLMREHYPMLLPDEHLCIFSKRALLLMARNAGLTVVAQRSFSNLTRAKLRNYLATQIGSLGRISTILTASFATLGAPIARAMDWSGFGTEMEYIFLRER